MMRLRVILAVAVCFFFFVACSPSESEIRAEVEKRINSSSNKGVALQSAEAAIMRQLEKEKQEIAKTTEKGGKR